jgi:hypothetical protein
VGTLRLDSVNLESVAVTVTWVVAFALDLVRDIFELAPPPGTTIPAARAAAIAATTMMLPPRRMTPPPFEPARTVYRVRASLRRRAGWPGRKSN